MLDLEAAYEDAVGHPPREAPEEFSWQWAYRGTPSEREKLYRDLIQAEAEAEYEQMSLC